MATMPKILISIGPQGFDEFLVGTNDPAERARALRFVADKMPALSRLDKELRGRPTNGLSTRAVEPVTK